MSKDDDPCHIYTDIDLAPPLPVRNRPVRINNPVTRLELQHEMGEVCRSCAVPGVEAAHDKPANELNEQTVQLDDRNREAEGRLGHDQDEEMYETADEEIVTTCEDQHSNIIPTTFQGKGCSRNVSDRKLEEREVAKNDRLSEYYQPSHFQHDEDADVAEAMPFLENGIKNKIADSVQQTECHMQNGIYEIAIDGLPDETLQRRTNELKTKETNFIAHSLESNTRNVPERPLSDLGLQETKITKGDGTLQKSKDETLKETLIDHSSESNNSNSIHNYENFDQEGNVDNFENPDIFYLEVLP